MAMKLQGKVAVVTGASKGIGAEIARRLAADGAAVVVNYSSSKEGADKVVADITKAGGRAVAVQANVANPEDVKRLFAETDKAFGGPIDVLVNNAGIYDFAPLAEVTPEHFHKQFDLNVLGLILARKEAAKRFGPDGGSVINISSVVSRAAPPTTSVYSATKAAVDAVTRSLAGELGPRKIRVNSLNPGMVATEGSHGQGSSEAISRSSMWPAPRSAASASPATSPASPRSWHRPTPLGSPAKPSSSPVDIGKYYTNTRSCSRARLQWCGVRGSRVSP
jgi:3-oxoacyl-[acyl-carrier protein] reductase